MFYRADFVRCHFPAHISCALALALTLVAPTIAQPAEAVGVDEHPGARVAADIQFRDERGRPVSLARYRGKPLLVLPVYYYCGMTCGPMLANLAAALNAAPLRLGQDYRVIALSFDEQEQPRDALAARKNYLPLLDKTPGYTGWHFLTGDKKNIARFTQAIGFRFRRLEEHAFLHPNLLVALAADGTIIRYLHGPRFLSFDIAMAVSEAERGKPGVTVRKILTYCFAYEPERKTYVFRTFRFVFLGTLILMIVFYLLLLRRRRRR